MTDEPLELLDARSYRGAIVDAVCYMQGVYGAYLKNAKFMNEQSAPSIALMGHCIVDLYGLRPSVAYQFAFVYIRYVGVTRAGGGGGRSVVLVP